jgi:hypothetical protein
MMRLEIKFMTILATAPLPARKAWSEAEADSEAAAASAERGRLTPGPVTASPSPAGTSLRVGAARGPAHRRTVTVIQLKFRFAPGPVNRARDAATRGLVTRMIT